MKSRLIIIMIPIMTMALCSCIGTASADLMIYNLSGIHNNPAKQKFARSWAVVLTNGKLVEVGEEQSMMNKYIVKEKLNARTGYIAPHIGGLIQNSESAQLMTNGIAVWSEHNSINIPTYSLSTLLKRPSVLDSNDFVIIKFEDLDAMEEQLAALHNQLTSHQNEILYRSLTGAPYILTNNLDNSYLDMDTSTTANFTIYKEPIFGKNWNGSTDARYIFKSGLQAWPK